VDRPFVAIKHRDLASEWTGSLEEMPGRSKSELGYADRNAWPGARRGAELVVLHDRTMARTQSHFT